MHSAPPASLMANNTKDNDLDKVETLPPSPTWSDAVTAPEINQDLTQVDSPNPENTKIHDATDLGDIVSAHPNLGQDLSNFLEKLTPWKSIMPGPLAQEMKSLEDVATRIGQTKQPAKLLSKRFTYEVLRLTMEEWQSSAPFILRDPVPVIQTYSNMDELVSASTGQSDTSKANLGGGVNMLRRVQINSSYLAMELSTITGISMQLLPIHMAPPFKLLVEYVPQIEHRLVLLEDRIRDLQAKSEHLEDEHSAGRTADIPGNEPTTKTSDQSDKYQEEKTKHDRELAILSETVPQLKCLLDFIQTEPVLQRTLSLRTQIEAGSLTTICFPDVWLLFKPGDLIISRLRDHWQLHKVYCTTGGQKQRKARVIKAGDFGPEARGRGKSAWTGTSITVEEDEAERFLREANFGIGSWTPFKVDCYTLDFVGDALRPIDGLWKIKQFLGEMKITDLPVYPVRFHSDASGILGQMEERGLKFLMSPGHKSYKGPSARLLPNESVHVIDGDVYVECDAKDLDDDGLVMSRAEVTESEELVRNSSRFLMGSQVDTRRSEEFMAENRFGLDMITVEEAKRSTDHLRLLPWVVNAYVFRLRRWENLDIDLLQEIDQRPEARDLSFEELVIPQKTRTLLVSLVEDHASKVKSHRDPAETIGLESSLRPQVDLVRGKGQGLIILLHGPPGSGKTSTAETIAAYTQRPLYSITCGDLGLKAEQVQKSLSEHTERAEKWGCVLLLDEADVFLMQRSWQDMERNALVSVFLRELEYYSGILFLTTNRPGVMDEAFLSRIHMAFRYPAIDLASTRTMWNNIMDRIQRDNETTDTEVVVTFKREQLLRFAEKDFLRRERQGKPWNGRQIRNAFNTAIGLGRYQRLQMLIEKSISPEEAAASGNKQLMEIKLTKANFQDISTAARSFEDYIHNLRGMDSEIARLSRVRDDNWGSEGPVAVKDYSQIMKTTMPELGVRSRSFVAKGGLGMRERGQSRTRPNQILVNPKTEGYVSELDNSEGSDDSSDNDG